MLCKPIVHDSNLPLSTTWLDASCPLQSAKHSRAYNQHSDNQTFFPHLTAVPGPAKSHRPAAFLELILRSASSQTSSLVLFMGLSVCQWPLCLVTFTPCSGRWQHKLPDGNTVSFSIDTVVLYSSWTSMNITIRPSCTLNMSQPI